MFRLGAFAPGDAQVRWSATGGLIGDAFFGPIFAGAAVGNGGSHRFYFSIGRVFR